MAIQQYDRHPTTARGFTELSTENLKRADFSDRRLNLDTLKLALYYDLATDKDGDPAEQNRKERAGLNESACAAAKSLLSSLSMMAMMVHGQTLRGLKQLIEKRVDRGARLTIVLAGHPRLKNDLRRPSRRKPVPGPPCLSLKAIQVISAAISPGCWNNARLTSLPRTS